MVEPIGQEQLYAQLGLLRPADAMLKRAYTINEERRWKSFRYRTSFYASTLPYDPTEVCGRKALYSFMGMPEQNPIGVEGRALMDVGTDTEHRFVRQLQKSGDLISPDPDSPQIALVDRPAWMVGRLDIAVEISGRPHIIEVKGKDHDKISEMRQGSLSFDPQHMAQLAFYLVKAHEQSTWIWPELEPCTSGSILYFSRQRPAHRFEFFLTLSHAQKIFDRGIGYVRYWRKLYEADQLPPVPEGYMWSKGMCKLCGHKKFSCKPDSQAGTVVLSKSLGIAHAIKHYGADEVVIDDEKVLVPRFNPTEARRKVDKRWKLASESKGTEHA